MPWPRPGEAAWPSGQAGLGSRALERSDRVSPPDGSRAELLPANPGLALPRESLAVQGVPMPALCSLPWAVRPAARGCCWARSDSPLPPRGSLPLGRCSWCSEDGFPSGGAHRQHVSCWGKRAGLGAPGSARICGIHVHVSLSPSADPGLQLGRRSSGLRLQRRVQGPSRGQLPCRALSQSFLPVRVGVAPGGFLGGWGCGRPLFRPGF